MKLQKCNLYQNDGWIQTFTGKKFYTTKPKPEDMCIEDIAHALSMMCRFSGHCLKFYSVAEHCVLLSEKVRDSKWGLLHDASEAYLVDIPRPIKPSLNNYYELERKIMDVVCERFSLTKEMPLEIKQADGRILLDERQQNMFKTGVSDEEWGSVGPPLGVTLQFWSPEVAEKRFLEVFYK